jgi:hypothetical protein
MMSNFKSATTHELLEQIKWGDSQNIIRAVDELALRQETSAAPQLLEILQTTDDTAIRNACALALSDLEDPSLFDVIVDLLKSKRTCGNQGTLLYAIGTYDCSSILPLLVDFVIDGNFETSRQSLSLISGIDTEVDERIFNACVNKLRSSLLLASQERRPLLVELLSIFEQES